MKIIKLGSFSVSSNQIVVTDPSFDYDEFGTITLKEVLAGKYFGKIETVALFDHSLVSALKICHSDYQHQDLEFAYQGRIDVDSGQAGFFDKIYFIKNQSGEIGNLATLYGLSCSITSSPKQAGITHKKGVVSSSGFGDSFYPVFVAKNSANKIVSAFINFISQAELEELK